MTPWTRLLHGNTRWLVGRSTADVDRGAARRAELSGAQNPFALVIGCSDSRVPAEILFDQGLGDLFVVRTAGHTLDAAAIGSAEYAVGVLGVQLIVMLGHEECGAVAAACNLIDEGQVPPGHIRDIAEQIVPDVLRARAAGATTPNEAGAHHSRYALDLLRQRSPLIDEALVQGSVDAVAARYSLSTGMVTEVEAGAPAKAGVPVPA